MLNYVMSFKFNSLLGILLYWTPLSFCVVGYTMRTARNYMNDTKEREGAEKRNRCYHPTDTIGTLIGRAVVSFIPIANLWAALFDVAPEVFRKTFSWVGRVFDIPLVPAKKKSA